MSFALGIEIPDTAALYSVSRTRDELHRSTSVPVSFLRVDGGATIAALFVAACGLGSGTLSITDGEGAEWVAIHKDERAAASVQMFGRMGCRVEQAFDVRIVFDREVAWSMVQVSLFDPKLFAGLDSTEKIRAAMATKRMSQTTTALGA